MSLIVTLITLMIVQSSATDTIHCKKSGQCTIICTDSNPCTYLKINCRPDECDINITCNNADLCQDMIINASDAKSLTLYTNQLWTSGLSIYISRRTNTYLYSENTKLPDTDTIVSSNNPLKLYSMNGFKNLYISATRHNVMGTMYCTESFDQSCDFHIDSLSHLGCTDRFHICNQKTPQVAAQNRRHLLISNTGNNLTNNMSTTQPTTESTVFYSSSSSTREAAEKHLLDEFADNILYQLIAILMLIMFLFMCCLLYYCHRTKNTIKQLSLKIDELIKINSSDHSPKPQQSHSPQSTSINIVKAVHDQSSPFVSIQMANAVKAKSHSHSTPEPEKKGSYASGNDSTPWTPRTITSIPNSVAKRFSLREPMPTQNLQLQAVLSDQIRNAMANITHNIHGNDSPSVSHSDSESLSVKQKYQITVFDEYNKLDVIHSNASPEASNKSAIWSTNPNSRAGSVLSLKNQTSSNGDSVLGEMLGLNVKKNVATQELQEIDVSSVGIIDGTATVKKKKSAAVPVPLVIGNVESNKSVWTTNPNSPNSRAGSVSLKNQQSPTGDSYLREMLGLNIENMTIQELQEVDEIYEYDADDTRVTHTSDVMSVDLDSKASYQL